MNVHAISYVAGNMNACLVLPQNGDTYVGDVPFADYVTNTAGSGTSHWELDSSASATSLNNVGDAVIPNSVPVDGPTGWWIGTLLVMTPPGIGVPGPYNFNITAWSADGDVVASSSTGPASWTRDNINVVANPFPDTSTGRAFSDLEANTTWTLANGDATASAGNGSSDLVMLDNTTAENENTSTLTGNTLTVTSNGANFNTNASLMQLTGPATKLLVDEWFLVPDSDTALAGLEFHADVFDGTYDYALSMMCDGTNWNFWSGSGWVSTGPDESTTYPCVSVDASDPTARIPLLTDYTYLDGKGAGPFPKWHHYQLYGTATGGQVTYQILYVDGLEVYGGTAAGQPLGYAFPATASTANTGNVVIGHTVDNNPSAVTNTVYYDLINITTW